MYPDPAGADTDGGGAEILPSALGGVFLATYVFVFLPSGITSSSPITISEPSFCSLFALIILVFVSLYVYAFMI